MADEEAVYYLVRTNVVGHSMVSKPMRDLETAILFAETTGEYIPIIKVLYGITEKVICAKCGQTVLLSNP